MTASAKPAISEIVDVALLYARRQWPKVRIDPPALIQRLVALGVAARDADAVGLALVQACLDRDPEAFNVFEETYLPEVSVALRRLSASSSERDEVTQQLRIALFAPAGRSKLEHFSGRGTLKGWLRAVAAQEFALLKRKEKKNSPVTGLADALASGTTLPETRWARAEYQAAFRIAIEQAIAALTTRERTALKLNALDGLSIDDLAALFHTHRSTAARWLAHARSQIESQVRASIQKQLRLSPTELSDAVNVAQREVPVTLERLLGKGDP